jgi:UDP-3-O-[3-hydroxymyristoyl] N-acetylglucosamine deacetylase
MACLAGLSIDNVIVELDAYEVPVMDGSGDPFTRLILEAGIKEQDAWRHVFVLKEPIELQRDGKFVGAYPDSTFRITCNIEFDHPLMREVSKARTFGFLHEVEHMISYGLARGGSLENAVVIDQHQILNSDGLRYKNEFVRHKLLDCIGDFSLLGMPILAHIVTTKSGHTFNHAFLEKFFEQKESWDTQSLCEDAGALCNPSKSLAI